MKVFKVWIENNTAISVMSGDGLEHGDTGFKDDNDTVEWFALECTDEKIAMEVAGKVVKMIWGRESA